MGRCCIYYYYYCRLKMNHNTIEEINMTSLSCLSLTNNKKKWMFMYVPFY